MPDTALDRMERILQILPLAAREGGIAYDELAGILGVDRQQIERDLAEVTDREFYHDAGTATDVQVALDADRVRVWTTGHLQRPLRLGLGEAAALDLGLRLVAAERDDPELTASMRGILERVARSVPHDLLDHFAIDGDPGAADTLRALFIDAARRRRRCRIRYLKPDAHAPEDREVEPYTVAYAEGRWYVIGNCPERQGIRAFRTDRILEASLARDAVDLPGDVDRPGDADRPGDFDPPGDFAPPADFDPSDYVDHGRVYRADQEVEVTVRYGGQVAPFLRERGEGEVLDDGGVLVRHRVADPAWLVRHVLQYGRDARVLEPDDFIHLVRAALARLA
jgi:predicted DNA-binding transcriptional regulator YafY